MDNWEKAKAWEDSVNREKGGAQEEPRWRWDCGFKLDYDGGLLRVSSRFYQLSPDIFDGSVSFLIGDDTAFEREFSSRRLEILQRDVEQYVEKVAKAIKVLCEENPGYFT